MVMDTLDLGLGTPLGNIPHDPLHREEDGVGPGVPARGWGQWLELSSGRHSQEPTGSWGKGGVPAGELLHERPGSVIS